ncbi:ABC transporter ATP-binding protein [Modicisalibacter tunisiensis]|nr:ABC transporter ATP-binding protein [Modicisalibacter tunisiensis]
MQIDALSVDFDTASGPIHALRHISLSVMPGRILGLVGESGCGKSSLAYSLIGLLDTNARICGGAIRFGEQDLAGLSESHWQALRGRRIAMIFQDPMTSLNPVRTIGQQLIDIQYRDRTSRVQKRSRALEFLEQVRIPDPASRLDSYPHELSGGMRQRVCIAMALLTRPELLIADEPTTALDATLEVQVIHLLRELQQKHGCSVVFVSHHLGTVAELCDDVAVMYAGEVVETGSVETVFRTPAHPYTQALLACDPASIREATRVLPTIPGELPDLRQVPQGCIFQARCPQVFDRCRQRSPDIYPVQGEQVARCFRVASEEPSP